MAVWRRPRPCSLRYNQDTLPPVCLWLNILSTSGEPEVCVVLSCAEFCPRMPCCAVPRRRYPEVVPRPMVLGRVYCVRSRWADESQQSRQGDKVGPKARGRVADATVATTTTPVGEARTRGKRPGAREAFWLFLGRGKTWGRVCGPITQV